jgi:transposase
LNQREYCEAHGLALKRFGNWRAKFKDEDLAPRKLLWRRGNSASPMTKKASHMTNGAAPEGAGVPPAAAQRRSFSEAEKRRIVDETCHPGVSVSQIARRYRIASRVLFRWKEGFRMSPEPVNPTFAPVEIVDAPDPAPSTPPPPPMIVERPAPGIEVELIGGRRVRFARDADPETVRRLVALLEGDTP